MSQELVHVDAFADRPFSGNPAAVCLLDEPGETAWMQKVARELGLSETAFLWAAGDGYELRWFTPAVEVDLCGHATLAAAHVLWESGRLGGDAPARFRTRSGPLAATCRDGWIELDFPARPAEACEWPEGLEEVLGTGIVGVGRSADDLLVEVAHAGAVRGLAPDLRELGSYAVRGVIVTAPSGDRRFDFVSRFFAPAAGLDEDPVTGSAHCTLGPFWGERLGKAELVGYQASARGGVVRVRLAGERVILAGRAVTVLRAELLA